MNKLTQALMEELTVEYVKVGPLQIPESVVISWVIMVLVVLSNVWNSWTKRWRPMPPTQGSSGSFLMSSRRLSRSWMKRWTDGYI